MKKIINALLPPVVSGVIKRIRRPKNKDMLFAGDDGLFKDAFSDNTIYAEYGCGASTIWVSNNVGCQIFSVDSSNEWIEMVKKSCHSLRKPILHLANIGPIGEWGTPLGYSKSENFKDYTDWIWTNESRPDIVLIDGRFRVCCFLTTLIKSDSGTKIFFDDYNNTPQYHFVERFIKPIETCGRQALFITPEKNKL